MSEDTEKPAEMLGFHLPYQFHLKLDTHDHGERGLSRSVFEESGECDHEDELSHQIAWAIARGLACLNCPPSSAEILQAIESHNNGRGLLAAVGYAASRCWTGCCELEKAVSIRIDIDKLMENENGAKKEVSAKVLRNMGVEIVRSE